MRCPVNECPVEMSGRRFPPLCRPHWHKVRPTTRALLRREWDASAEIGRLTPMYWEALREAKEQAL
jgi:hypothetical protein